MLPDRQQQQQQRQQHHLLLQQQPSVAPQQRPPVAPPRRQSQFGPQYAGDPEQPDDFPAPPANTSHDNWLPDEFEQTQVGVFAKLDVRADQVPAGVEPPGLSPLSDLEDLDVDPDGELQQFDEDALTRQYYNFSGSSLSR
eukprot:m.258238 g.258238  ORF g.258238 m.258238 type:complete len:140 (+) comp54577_c1_seq6:177-596(+)